MLVSVIQRLSLAKTLLGFEITNLRWVVHTKNLIRAHLTHDEASPIPRAHWARREPTR